MRKSLFKSLVSTGVVLAIFTGCSKKEAVDATPAAAPAEGSADATATAAPAPKPAAAAAEVLPGASAVRDSLAKKDYQNAVGGLLALRGAATGDRYTEYLALYGEVIDTLRTESRSDRKAAEALVTLQAMDRGR